MSARLFKFSKSNLAVVLISTLVAIGSGFISGQEAFAVPSTGPAVNTVAPLMTDSTTPSKYLTGDTVSVTTGTWSSATGTYGYEWYRCTSSAVTNAKSDVSCSNINGASSSTYLLTADDLGSYVYPVVTATGTDASTTAVTANPTLPAFPFNAVLKIAAYYGAYSSYESAFLAAGAIWISLGSSLKKYDPVTGALITTVSVYATDASFDGTYIWATDYNYCRIAQIDPSTAMVLNRYSVGAYGNICPVGIASDGTNVYVSTHSATFGVNGASYVFNIASHTITTTIPTTNPGFYSVAVDSQYAWIADAGASNVRQINKSNGATVRSIAIAARRIVSDGTYAWFSTSSAVYQIDEATGATVRTIGTVSQPKGLTLSGRYLWIGSQSGVVTAVDIANGGLVWSYDPTKSSNWSFKTGSYPAYQIVYTGSLLWSLGYNLVMIGVGQPALNTIPPVVSDTTTPGQYAQGDVLSVSNGTWSNGSGSYTYQWYRCDTQGVTNPATNSSCSAVTNATSQSYYTGAADSGKFMMATVSTTGTDDSTATAPSNEPSQAVVRPPTALSPPVLTDTTSTGRFTVGDVISTTSGTWSPDTGLTFGYSWYACTLPQGTPGNSCAPISGATSSTLTLTSAMKDKYIVSQVSATSNGLTGYGAVFATKPVGAVVLTKPGPVLDGATAPGDGHVTVTWTAPNTGDVPTSYEVSVPGFPTCVIDLVANPDAALSCDFTGLTNGTEYTFTIVAKNAQGSSTTVDVNATPATTPSSVTSGSATGGDTQVIVSWAAPASDGSAPITSYTVSISGQPDCVVDLVANPGAALSCTFTGLTNGTEYTATIVATNAQGNSSGVQVSATPHGTPGPVQSAAATGGDTTVSVTWSAPTSGDVVTSYVVSIPGQSDCVIDLVANPSAALSCTFSGLTNGTNYTATIVAKNGANTSSSVTASATPYGTPVTPSISGVAASNTGDGAVVTFTHPTNNSGRTITDYTVYAYDANGNVVGSCTTTATSCTVPGLTKGQAYSFKVQANSSPSNSALSSPRSFTLPNGYQKVNAYIRGWSYAQREISDGMRKAIGAAARAIVAGNNKTVTVTGFANFTALKTLSQDRAVNVAAYLRRELNRFGGRSITIKVVNGGCTTKFGGTVLNRVAVIQGR